MFILNVLDMKYKHDNDLSRGRTTSCHFYDYKACANNIYFFMKSLMQLKFAKGEKFV